MPEATVETTEAEVDDSTRDDGAMDQALDDWSDRTGLDLPSDESETAETTTDDTTTGDDDKSTSDDEVSTRWTPAELAAIKASKLSDSAIDALGDEAEAHVAQLVKMRKSAAKKAATKAATVKEETPPETVVEEDFSDDDWGDENGITKLNKLRADNAAMRTELTEMRDSFQGIQKSATYRTLDRFIGNLPEDVRKPFGDGPTEDMSEDSAEYDTRTRLVRKAAALRKDELSSGVQMTMAEALDEALRVVAGDRLEKAAGRKAIRRDRNKALQPRPSADSKAPQTGDKSTADAIQDWAEAANVTIPD